MKKEVFFPDFLTLFLKFIIKSLIPTRHVNFFSSRLPKSCSFQKHNAIGKECSNFEGDECKYRDIIGKMPFFLKHSRFPYLFVGGSTLHSCYILHIKI